MKTDFQNFLEDARIVVLSMSNSRSKSISKIEELAEPILLHLALVAAYPDSSYQKHWRNELSAFLSRVCYYQAACKVSLSDSTVLQLVYERPLGTERDKAAALMLAKAHMKRGNLGHSPLPVVNSALYFSFPFKQFIITTMEDIKTL